MKRIIYMDYSATTPCDKTVLDKMLPFFTENFGNAGSKTHSFGWAAEKACEKARNQIAKVIHCFDKEVIFTSGATESNNLALKGCIKYLLTNKGKRHIITLATEHKCILQTCCDLEKEGFSVTYLDVMQNGLIDLNKLEESINEETGLISVAWVHNEIGVIQPMKDIGIICKKHSIIFHTDAAQAVGKVEINVQDNNIDLLSMSGHKIYGPKGIGALYVRRGVRLNSIFSGGGQEKGLRSGTLAVPLCVGLGYAIKKAEKCRASEYIRIKNFYDYMYSQIFANLKDVHLNGDASYRVPHNLNISFGGVEGESLIVYLEGIAVSTGSACTSSSLEGSYVLNALKIDEDLSHSALRISFGRYTTVNEVKYATDKIITEVNKLRAMSPLWEMRQNGIDLNTIKWNH